MVEEASIYQSLQSIICNHSPVRCIQLRSFFWGGVLFFWSTLFMDKQLVIDFSEVVNTNLLTVTEVKQSDATVLSHIK